MPRGLGKLLYSKGFKETLDTQWATLFLHTHNPPSPHGIPTPTVFLLIVINVLQFTNIWHILT